MDNNIATPGRTKQILKEYQLSLQKGLGQNFLVDKNILEKIIKAVELNGEETVIEIGPGIGSLTQQLLNQLDRGRLIVIEKDKKLVPVLKDLFSAYSNLEIVNQDVLAIDWPSFLADRRPFHNLKLIGNLPYYITTPIIMGLLEAELPLSRLVFMVQKEVAERMTASPGGKEYGALSVAVQFYSRAEIIYHVPPTVFIPQPNVYSSIISLAPYTQLPFQVEDREFFFKVVRAIFQQRRKTIKNSLTKSPFLSVSKDVVIESLKACNIDQMVRGETLEIAKMAQLSNILWKKIN